MLSHAEKSAGHETPPMASLIERLLEDARHWTSAEAALARIELSALRRQLVKAVISAALGIAALLATLVALTEAGIALLAPVLGTPAFAALLVAAILAVIVIACVLVLRMSFRWETESIFFRWLGHRPPGVAKDAAP